MFLYSLTTRPALMHSLGVPLLQHSRLSSFTGHIKDPPSTKSRRRRLCLTVASCQRVHPLRLPSTAACSSLSLTCESSCGGCEHSDNNAHAVLPHPSSNPAQCPCIGATCVSFSWAHGELAFTCLSAQHADCLALLLMVMAGQHARHAAAAYPAKPTDVQLWTLSRCSQQKQAQNPLIWKFLDQLRLPYTV